MSNFPCIIRYLDDKSLALCLTVGDIQSGRAFKIEWTKVRRVR